MMRMLCACSYILIPSLGHLLSCYLLHLTLFPAVNRPASKGPVIGIAKHEDSIIEAESVTDVASSSPSICSSDWTKQCDMTASMHTNSGLPCATLATAQQLGR